MIDRYNKLFIYDNGILKNKIKRGHNSLVGDSTKSLTDGYLCICIDRKRIRTHRVIWEMHNGKIPIGYEIDHIDHDRINNKIENLRMVTRAENIKNMSKSKRNKSGVTGITWYLRDLKWRARIYVDGKDILIGYFTKLSDAIKARKLANIKYGFHENHGI